MKLEERLDIAQSMVDSGNFQRSIDYLNNILEDFPSNDWALTLRGYSKHALTDTEGGIIDLKKAIDSNNKNHLAHWYLSEIYADRYEFQEALPHITSAFNLNKSNFNYTSDLAYILQQLKKYHESNKYCNLIIDEFPADLFALNTRGYNYMMLKEFDKAIKDFKRALEENPNDPITINNLGFIMIEIKKFQLAKVYFENAITLSPQFAFPYDNLGYVYYLDKQYKKALDLINKSIDLDPSNSWAYKNKAF